MGQVEVILVDAHGKGGGAVADNELLEDVAVIVAGNHAALDYVVRAVFLCGDFVAIILGVVLPEQGLEIGNRDVGLLSGHGDLELRFVKLVLTAGQRGGAEN